MIWSFIYFSRYMINYQNLNKKHRTNKRLKAKVIENK